MEVRLLVEDYKKIENLYKDFVEDKIADNELYISDEFFFIEQAPDFPIYMAKGSEKQKKQDFMQAFRIVSEYYIDYDREIIMNERFWHSLLLTEKRDFIIHKYPEVLKSENKFRNIVLKKFDWENYIYKVILGAQYINDNVECKDHHEKYYDLIVENLDLYNYIIKYEIFRNDKFLINILDIVDELNLSSLLKAKIKGREDLSDDERYGRRVIFEFNKSYPVVMSPMLEKEELKDYFIKYLKKYYKDDLSPKLDNKHEKKSDEVYLSNTRKDLSVSSLNNHDVEDKFNSKNFTSNREVNKKNIVKNNQVDLIVYLDNHDLKYIDNRGKGGTLWVIGDRRIEYILKPLRDQGINFVYLEKGGRASKYKPSWYLR